MSYQFTPLSDEELNASQLIEDGTYNFEVAKSTRKTSEAGNPMCVLQLRVWDKDGRIHFIFDRLVFSSANLCIRKIKHFCDAVGLKKEYKEGNLPEEMVGLCGKVEIGTQDRMPNPNGGFFDAKNVVIDYIDDGTVQQKPEVKDEFNDDIPF